MRFWRTSTAAVPLAILLACCGGDTQPQRAPPAPAEPVESVPSPAPPDAPEVPAAPAPFEPLPPPADEEPYLPPEDWCGTGARERPSPQVELRRQLFEAMKPDFGPWMPADEKGVYRRSVTTSDLLGKALRSVQYGRRVGGTWKIWSRAEEAERRKKSGAEPDRIGVETVYGEWRAFDGEGIYFRTVTFRGADGSVEKTIQYGRQVDGKWETWGRHAAWKIR